MSRIYVVEPGPTGGPGAMGALILVESLRRAGHEVSHVRLPGAAGDDAGLLAPIRLPRPDAWFVSCVYVRQWLFVRQLFAAMELEPYAADRQSTDPLVCFGGQIAITPEPMALFADVLALGDGEHTGLELARLAPQGRHAVMDQIRGRPGFYVPLYDAPPTPFRRVEGPFSPVVVRPGDTRTVPTIELARGCASKCAFCPIGWAGGTYREAPADHIMQAIHAHRGRPINLFAPDYSSVSYSLDVDRAVAEAGCSPRGKDARLDATARRMAAGGQVREYAFGVEGLSERMRRAVGKPLSSGKIIDTMATLAAAGVAVKWYLIFGLPGETPSDRAEFMDLLAVLAARVQIRLDLTLTQFQSVPHTPLQWADNRFNQEAYDWVMALRAWLRDRDDGTGTHRWMAMRPKQRDLHEHDAWLQRSGREIAPYLLDARLKRIERGTWRRHADDVDAKLAAIDVDAVTPWSHVDVGVDRNRVRLAWARYQRNTNEQIQPNPTGAAPASAVSPVGGA